MRKKALLVQPEGVYNGPLAWRALNGYKWDGQTLRNVDHPITSSRRLSMKQSRNRSTRKQGSSVKLRKRLLGPRKNIYSGLVPYEVNSKFHTLTLSLPAGTKLSKLLRANPVLRTIAVPFFPTSGAIILKYSPQNTPLTSSEGI